MLIILHVVLAVASLLTSTLNYTKPVKKLLGVSYSFAGGTLFSGVLLIIFNNASIIRTCVTGIVFFAIVTVLNELARTKLVAYAEKTTA